MRRASFAQPRVSFGLRGLLEPSQSHALESVGIGPARASPVADFAERPLPTRYRAEEQGLPSYGPLWKSGAGAVGVVGCGGRVGWRRTPRPVPSRELCPGAGEILLPHPPTALFHISEPLKHLCMASPIGRRFKLRLVDLHAESGRHRDGGDALCQIHALGHDVSQIVRDGRTFEQQRILDNCR